MAAEKANKDKEMASRMKREGVERHTMNCPCCHQRIARERFDPKAKKLMADGLSMHLRVCKG